MFERFTERAREVVVLAQGEARALEHNYIGTEHLLLGLLAEGEGLGARVLESLDITLLEIQFQVARIIGQGDEVTAGQIPFTPRAKKVLELALREALSLGHKYIGTEHILLGLVRENEGVASRILLDFDADAEKIRTEIMRALEAGSTDEPPPLELPPDLEAELLSIRRQKEDAIEVQELELAARLRVRERRLGGLGRSGDLEGFRQELSDPLPPPPLPPAFGRSTGAHRVTLSLAAPSRGEESFERALGGMAPMGRYLFVLGWLLGLAALGLGVLLGWAIWG